MVGKGRRGYPPTDSIKLTVSSTPAPKVHLNIGTRGCSSCNQTPQRSNGEQGEESVRRSLTRPSTLTVRRCEILTSKIRPDVARRSPIHEIDWTRPVCPFQFLFKNFSLRERSFLTLPAVGLSIESFIFKFFGVKVTFVGTHEVGRSLDEDYSAACRSIVRQGPISAARDARSVFEDS